jgi:hypothetical protein
VAHLLDRLGKPAFDEVMKICNVKSAAEFGEAGVLERVLGELETKLSAFDSQL